MQETIISHLKPVESNNETKWVIQPNDEHCESVARLAADFSRRVHLDQWAEIIGLLHDRGKEQDDFQRYIKYVSGMDRSNSRTLHRCVN